MIILNVIIYLYEEGAGGVESEPVFVYIVFIYFVM